MVLKKMRTVMKAADQRLLKKAQRKEAKLRARIEKAEAAGETHKARFYRDLYTSSFSAKLTAAHEVNTHKKRPARRRLPFSELKELAAGLDPWAGTNEPVRIGLRPKASGGTRPITIFGFEHRTLQKLMRNALYPFARFHPGQYSPAGRGGKQAACAAIKEALEGDYKHAAKIDIRDCFGSINAYRLSQYLPLRRDMVGSVLIGRNLNLTTYPNRSHLYDDNEVRVSALLSKGRRGIPQGSAVSSLVSDIVIADLLSAVPEGVKVVAYADDILLLTRTRDEISAAVQALQRAVRHSPYGPFTLKTCETKRACDGFDFLGYRFKRRATGAPKIRPSDEAFKAFRTGFRQRKLLDMCYRFTERQAWRYVANWLRTKPLWSEHHKDIFRSSWEREALQFEEACSAITPRQFIELLRAVQSMPEERQPL